MSTQNGSSVSTTRASKRSGESKPSKVLPTNRVAFEKQLAILRAFGAASEPNGHAVANVDVSRIVDLHPSTIGLINPFFTDVGFLRKASEGLVPATEVVEFNRNFEWNPTSASHRLATIVSRSWFALELLPKLRFDRMSVSEAIENLAVAASAGPAYKGQLETLLDYLHTSGVAIVENGQVRLGRTANGDSVDKLSTVEVNNTTPMSDEVHKTAPPIATNFATSSAGMVKFNISVNVDMTEFAGWNPERISAFFSGIAQVLAAKGQIEERSSTSAQ